MVKCCREFSMKNCVIFLFYVLLLFEKSGVYSDILAVEWKYYNFVVHLIFLFSRRKIICGALLGWGRGWGRRVSSHSLYYFCVVFVLCVWYFLWLLARILLCLTKFWFCGMSDVYVYSEMEKETCWESLKIYIILNGSFLIQILKNWVHGTTKKFGTIGQQCALLTVLSTTINLIIRYSLVINFGVSYLIS